MDKYKVAKDACKKWEKEYTRVVEENNILKQDVERWKKLSENLPDIQTVDDLTEENRTLTKTVKMLKKELENLNLKYEDKYRDKINTLEREKIIYEGKIQHLEETKKDLQERYNELKSDYRTIIHDRKV